MSDRDTPTWRAKKPKWENDKGTDTPDNTYTRQKWIDWTKQTVYDKSWGSKTTTKKAWDDSNTKKGEDNWENKWEDKVAEPDKMLWGDSAAAADPVASTHTEVATPADST